MITFFQAFFAGTVFAFLGAVIFRLVPDLRPKFSLAGYLFNVLFMLNCLAVYLYMVDASEFWIKFFGAAIGFALFTWIFSHLKFFKESTT